MSGIFNYDGAVVQTTNKIADCLCLSLLWLVSAIPVFTIGAANAALYYAMNKSVRRGESGILKTYWQGFRSNFRQGTALWLMMVPVYALLAASCYSTWLMCASGNLPAFFFWVCLLLVALVLIWASFLFPYQARFRNSNRQILKNCVYIAIMDFPAGLGNLLLLIAAALATVYVPMTMPFLPGLYMVLSCWILEPVFRKYMSEEDRKREEELEEMMK